jgi:hypothetical protein
MTVLLDVGCASRRRGLVDSRFACCGFTLRELEIPRSDWVGFFRVLPPWEHCPA